MKSLQTGKNTSKAEITNISEHGFWILLKSTEYFLPFEKYPWFKNASISSITDLELLHDHHLYWPKLDVDLTTKILETPGKYSLTYK